MMNSIYGLLIAIIALLAGIVALAPVWTKKLNWRDWKIFASSPEAVKLSRYENEIIDLVGRKKQLEIDIQNNEAQKSALRLEYEQKLREERAKFELEKKQIQNDMQIEQKQIKASYEIKEKELLALKQLEVKKLGQECDLKILEVKTTAIQEYEIKLASERSKLIGEHETWIRENYTKLTQSMQDLHEKGNHTTKFVQEMAGKLLAHVPNVHRLGIDVGSPNKETMVLRHQNDDAAIPTTGKPA